MATWRTETHWYRPIRLTDERRFIRDMEQGWIDVGAYGTAQERYQQQQAALWEAMLDSGFFDPSPTYRWLARH